MRKSMKVLPLVAALVLCSNLFAAPSLRHAGPRVQRHARPAPPAHDTTNPGGGQETTAPVLPGADLQNPSADTGWHAVRRSPIVPVDGEPETRNAVRLGRIITPPTAIKHPPVIVHGNVTHTFTVGFDGENGFQAEGGYTFHLR